MMKNSGIFNHTEIRTSRRGALRKWLAGFLAASTAFTMLSGSAATLMAEEPATEYALAGAGSGHDVTVHFGNEEDQDILIHVNGEEGQESETLAGLGAETETEISEETEAETQILEETETETESAPQDARKVYTYQDGKVFVTATLEVPDAVPEDAVLRVTQITPDSTGYNYDAYMNALNEKSDDLIPASEETEADEEKSGGFQVYGSDKEAVSGEEMTRESNSNLDNTFNDSNTLLYDVAFIVQQKDEDGTPIPGTEYEYQPKEGTVTIEIQFIDNQLKSDLNVTEQEEVTLVHLPLTDEVKENVPTTADATDIDAGDVKVEVIEDAEVSVAKEESATVTLDGLSVIAVYGNNGSSGNSYYTGQLSGYDSVSIESLTNDSLNYGITANTWNFLGRDGETSLAVKDLIIENGGQNGSNDSKSGGANAQYWIVGKVTGNTLEIKGYEAYVTTTNDVKNGTNGNSRISDTNVTTHWTIDTYENITQTINKMIDDAKTVSSNLAGKDSLTAQQYEEVQSASNKINDAHMTLDFTQLDDNKTYYIDVDKWPDLSNVIQNKTSGLIINKLDGQKVVFNFKGSGPYHVQKWEISNTLNGVTTSYGADSLADMTTATADIIEDVIFNFTKASEVHLHNTSGVFIAPNTHVYAETTCGGWLISNEFTSKDEWHFVYDKVYRPDKKNLSAMKHVDGTAANVSGFKFRLYQKDSSGWTFLQEKQNVNEDITFEALHFGDDNCKSSENIFYYKIEEDQNQTTVNNMEYTPDTSVYYAKIIVTRETEGSVTVFTASTPEYYLDEGFTEKLDSVPVFNNSGKTEISVRKEWKGTPKDSVSVQLKRKAVQGEASDKPIGEPVSLPYDGKWEYTWSGLDKSDETGHVYQYYVEETPVEGYVTTYGNGKVSGKASAEEAAVEGGGTVTITNTKEQDIGNLKLLKTSQNSTTPGKTKFTVKNASGKIIQEVYYEDFENGVYIVSNLDPGQYTVIEDHASATKGREQYTLTVTANNQPGNEAVIEVQKGQTAEVSFVNTYTETTGISVTKEWTGGYSGDVDEVRFKLYRTATKREGHSVLVEFYDSWNNYFCQKQLQNVESVTITDQTEYWDRKVSVSVDGLNSESINQKNSKTIVLTANIKKIVVTGNYKADECGFDDKYDVYCSWTINSGGSDGSVPETSQVGGVYSIKRENNWVWTDQNLPAMDQNYVYTYYVKEVDENGNEITSDSPGKMKLVSYTNNEGISSGNITIKNTLQTQFTVDKSWVGKSDVASVQLNRATIPAGKKALLLYYTYTGGKTENLADPRIFYFDPGDTYSIRGKGNSVPVVADGNVRVSVNGSEFVTKQDPSNSVVLAEGTISDNTIVQVDLLNGWADIAGALDISVVGGAEVSTSDIYKGLKENEQIQDKKTWEGLPVCAENGDQYLYYLIENPKGSYQILYGPDRSHSAILINTELGEISVTKRWAKKINSAETDTSKETGGHISFNVMRRKLNGNEPVGNDEIVYIGKPSNLPAGVTVGTDGMTCTLTAQGVEGNYSWPTATIGNLPTGTAEVNEDGSITQYRYEYYVVESPEDAQGKDVRYSTDGGENWIGTLITFAVSSNKTDVLIRNMYSSYSMPATGGEGTRRIYLISITLIALAGAGLIMIRRRRERTR